MMLMFMFIGLMLASLACQFSLPGFGGTEESTQVGKVLFYDDFSNPKTGWNRATADTGVTDYVDGIYRIYIGVPNTDIWAHPGLDFDDVRIEVDATKVSGDNNNRFGIVCRLLENNRFYAFLISSDGYAGIGKVNGDSYQLIGGENLQPADAVQQGSSINHIRADCIGNTLTLYVNGQVVTEVQDDEFQSGDVGLIAGTYENPGTDIHFDSFIVLQP